MPGFPRSSTGIPSGAEPRGDWPTGGSHRGLPIHVAALMLIAACGGTPSSSSLDELFEATVADDARQRAPDLYAAAVRARADSDAALEADDVPAAADHATRARLLLLAAEAEADRLVLEEHRLTLVRRTRRADEAVARDTRARLALETEMTRLRSAQVAGEEAARVFTQAEVDEERRFRGQAEQRDRVQLQAAAAVATRSRLLLAAAMALGASDADAAGTSRAIAAVASARDGNRAMLIADRALRAAIELLGTARSRHPGPTTDEIAALHAGALSAGFAAEQLDRGVVIGLRSAFTGRGPRLSADVRDDLERLADLIKAHPHGPVQVHGYGGGDGATAERLAIERVEQAVAYLRAQGIGADRLQPMPLTAEPPTNGDRLEVVFVSYGPAIAGR